MLAAFTVCVYVFLAVYFLSFVSILLICLNIRDKNQKRFVTYLKGFLCFHVYVLFYFFLLFFFFLLIGEKVNTQWLSHAIFDPVVSWSYFFNLSCYSMIYFVFVFFLCLCCLCFRVGCLVLVNVSDDWVILTWDGCDWDRVLFYCNFLCVAIVWVYLVWMFCCFAQ